MKKNLGLLAMVVAFMLGGNAAWADGDFYVIAGGGGAGVGTKITSVPYSIKASGFYFLTGNLTLDSNQGGSAIYVDANDVTIDLMGFSLSYAGSLWSVGVYMGDRTNVELRNGTVRGFTQAGIMGNEPGSNHRVVNVRALDNIGGHGILLRGSSNLVKNCTASNNVAGFIIVSGNISDCVAASNTWGGIWHKGPGSVLNNTAFNNPGKNFFLGNEVPTSILADGNSAYGLNPNYDSPSGTTGVVITAHNAGTP
jgi:hypothetical protein